MPKRTDIDSVVIIGAGPIVIGQACEFDYSGAQACKALREEGYRVVLINSNPATIMTDPDMADATYIEPITYDVVSSILEKERYLHPHEVMALLPTMGGQTALNMALSLSDGGILRRLGIELIGARADVIEKAEDREKFRRAMEGIGLECPRSEQVGSLEGGMRVLESIGFPVIIRPSFTLGGSGGGIAYTLSEFESLMESGLRLSPVGSVLVEESVLGWKEFEMEVVRDGADNCIIVCAIENIDPMGVHTGDSITVAPALTLTDKEYQRMRDASIATLREIGVDTGGSNVQFAVNPEDGRLLVIEMNPRVSRSSALASKATGFPIAKIAAKLAIGYFLDELSNDMTRVTPASFEPTIDYVVTKIPRFQFEKFAQSDISLSTSMRSLGETMAIGRSFHESLQKALRSLETGLDGFDESAALVGADKETLLSYVSRPTAERLLYVGDALRAGVSIDEIYLACKIDKWFLRCIGEIISTEEFIREHGLPTNFAGWAELKRMGFSDNRLGRLSGISSSEIYSLRESFGVVAVFKHIDTCAGEFASHTSYIYSTYEHSAFHLGDCESVISDRDKIIILGGGPNRIGQGIEFDYCCVHAAYALSSVGYETIMVNCNPETVSTDYDTSDKLYFEPLTAEDVIAIVRKERSCGHLLGVIVQFGGQTPLKLASFLESEGIAVLGTSPDAIDLAEDRGRFQQLLQRLNLRQPANGVAVSESEAFSIAESIGYPIVIRPSYVLGGRAMEIIHDSEQLGLYIGSAVEVSGDSPVLLDQYLPSAIEVDVDAISDGEDTYITGIMEHVEEAGIHSGDSACVLPAFSLSAEIQDNLRRQTCKLARALKVVGLMNVQYAIKGGDIYVLEVNPRASRTVPFVAKATGVAVAAIAARVMAGEKLLDLGLSELTHGDLGHVAVKESVFPFERFSGVDVVLGPEMRSTGEVMGIDDNLTAAFAKSQLGAGCGLRFSSDERVRIFISVRDSDKAGIVEIARKLLSNGVELVGTGGTVDYLRRSGIEISLINKVAEGSPHVVDAMVGGEIDVVFNTSEGKQSLLDSLSLRRTALWRDIPYYTTLAGIKEASEAILFLFDGELAVFSLQDYFRDRVTG